MNKNRFYYAAPALACAALLSYGYYLQYFERQDPCPLCLVQRAFYFLLLIVFAIAAVHFPRGRGKFAYCAAAFLAALGGTAAAARQVWLQHLPADQVPACGPDLYFMIENFPLKRTLEKLFTGSGQCAEVHWKFLGLSIAEWSLAWFVAFLLYAVWLAFRGGKAIPSS